MARPAFSPAQVLALLAEAPPRIAALTAGLTPEQLRTAPAAGEWSANEVLAHLRACADQWGGCLAAIVAEDHPALRAINPRTWIKSTDYVARPFRASLRAYNRQRQALVAVLEPLPPEGWERTATVTGAGAVLVRSAYFYAEWLAHHERRHLKQIAQIAETLRA